MLPESEEIAVADPADPGADGRTVRMDASFCLSDVTVRRDPADPEQVRQYLTDLLAGRAYVPMDRR